MFCSLCIQGIRRKADRQGHRRHLDAEVERDYSVEVCTFAEQFGILQKRRPLVKEHHQDLAICADFRLGRRFPRNLPEAKSTNKGDIRGRVPSNGIKLHPYGYQRVILGPNNEITSLVENYN